jgi:hypothetical protein
MKGCPGAHSAQSDRSHQEWHEARAAGVHISGLGSFEHFRNAQNLRHLLSLSRYEAIF